MPEMPYEWAWPIEPGSRVLTGRWRTRVQAWTGSLVLQIEERYQRCHFLTGQPGDVVLHWRDATHNDVVQLKGLQTEMA